MPTGPLNRVIPDLLADLGPGGGGATDGELLTRFLRGRNGDALAALVRRHAPMVWGVCRRILRDHHDAEDAFQATFLVLVRKAPDVPGPAAANWLYGVARQTAVRLRALSAKRGRREAQVANMPEPSVVEVRDADLQSVLDEELSRLPDHYRGVVVLCDLGGMTRKEAARQLGIPEGSVASRLARARAMLAKRLARRGLVLPGASVALSASASAPPDLVASTIRAASLLAAGRAAGVVSARVAALTEGVAKVMFVTRIKSVLTVVLVVGLALAGAMGLLYQTQAAEQSKAKEEQPAANKDQKPSQEKQAMTKEERLRVLIGKVLEAHGGEDKLNNLQFTMTVKVDNGTTDQYFVQPPKGFRWESQHRDSTTRRICILLPNGRHWWHRHANGDVQPVFYTGVELPMVYHLDRVKFFGPRQVLRVKDADHRVALLEEETIDGRAAVGVEVTYAGPEKMRLSHRMYFDKETHLLARLGETYYCDYKKFDGIPVARKEKHPHAGTGAWEAEVTDFRVVDKFDPKLFEQP
jgi:RNA polymerase sigma factor (sigma-70 family)